MFGIFPEGEHVIIYEENFQKASIVIDEFKEYMYIPLTYWNMIDYKKHWEKSLQEGLNTRKYSALAVTMYEPKLANFIFTWVIYYENNIAFLQNTLLLLDQHPDFSPEYINDFIEPREIYTEEGGEISEWRTDLSNIIDFYTYLKNQP